MAAAFVCRIDETEQGEPEQSPIESITDRDLLLSSYDVPKWFYARGWGVRRGRSAARWLGDLGIAIWYADRMNHTGRTRRTSMDVDALVEKWKRMVVGLALAHTKDDADRMEAAVEECLTPILSAPIKQVREFASKLSEALKADEQVPYLVWRSYEFWIEQMKGAPDEDVKELKTQLAREIAEMVESDVQAQLPDALVRALQWRSPSTLAQVREVVKAEKEAGRPVRLKGRESCLFLEAGGTDAAPAVCVQI